MKILLLIVLIFNFPMAWAENSPEKVNEVRNYYKFNDDVSTGGRFSYEDSAELKKSGFKTILDLRTVAEGVQIERMAVENNGMTYKNLPITGKNAFYDENVASFTKLVNEAEKPLLIHCGSGNRVGMLYGQYMINNGSTLAEAIKAGKRMGMKSQFATIMREKYSTKK